MRISHKGTKPQRTQPIACMQTLCLCAFVREYPQEARLPAEKGEVNADFIVESRGRREDAEVELKFRRICDGENILGQRMLLDIEMVKKRANLPGLQIADLVARPIGIKHLRPDKPNRAYDIVEKKWG